MSLEIHESVAETVARNLAAEGEATGHVGEGHEHVEFLSASLVSAVVCTGCGGYVDGNRQADHQSFHDRVRTIESKLGIGEREPPEDTLF